MLIIGYCMGIRSERRLCEEVHLNLAYRWFCRLGLDGDVPDHSTFSKNRHGRFRDSDVLRELFETTVARCMAEGLVGGEVVAGGEGGIGGAGGQVSGLTGGGYVVTWYGSGADAYGDAGADTLGHIAEACAEGRGDQAGLLGPDRPGRVGRDDRARHHRRGARRRRLLVIGF